MNIDDMLICEEARKIILNDERILLETKKKKYSRLYFYSLTLFVIWAIFSFGFACYIGPNSPIVSLPFVEKTITEGLFVGIFALIGLMGLFLHLSKKYEHRLDHLDYMSKNE